MTEGTKTARDQRIDAIRAQILSAMLPDIAFDGFTDEGVRRTAAELGLSEDDSIAAFPHGAESLVEAFSAWADERMQEKLQEKLSDAPHMKIRARITDAVWARLEALGEHREASRRAAAFLALPHHAALASKLLYRTVDAIWRAAGDQSVDFNFYTKRAILTGVYGATFLYWLTDSSEDYADTQIFLDKRIKDVMHFEKFKADAKRVVGGFPDLFAIAGNLRAALRPRTR
jgi:ubiquinone biosynthesis protein COQ9